MAGVFPTTQIVAPIASEVPSFFLIAISTLNSNKFFIAVLMLLMNLSGRYLDLDLLPVQKDFLQSKLVRRFVVFAVAFMATRDILTSLIITGIFIIFAFHLFNTRSPYCILPEWIKSYDVDQDGIITIDELNKLKEYSELQNYQ